MCLFSGSVLAVFLTAKMESWINLTQDEAASSGSTIGNSVANMDQHVRYILPLIFSLAFAQRVPPEMKYLRGVPRLNNESFMDYYFTCITVGQILQWRVSQDVHVFGFTGGETTGTIKTCTGTSNLQCITTLLSSQSFQAGLFTFHSVLIVSTTTSRNIFNVVTCGNEINSTSVTINDTAIAQNVILNRRSQNVSLQYLFSANIVNDSTTSFYLCGVNDVIQAWQTNGLPYVFRDTDAIGRDRTFLSADETVAVQQTILMGREPYSLISILLLSIPYVNVTCASSQFPETLFHSEVKSTTVTTPPPTAPPPTDPPTTAPPTTTEGFTTPAAITNGNDSSTSIGTTKNTEQASDTVAIIASVLGVIIFLFIVVVLPALIIVGIRCYRVLETYQVKDNISQPYGSLNESGLKLKDVGDEPKREVVSEDRHDEALDDVVVVTDSIKVNGDNNFEQEAEADEPEGKDSEEKNDHLVMPADQVLLEDDDKNDVQTEEGQPDIESENEDKDIQVVLPATETIMENVEKNSEDLVKEKLPMLETEEQQVQDLVKEKLPMLEAQEQQVQDLVKEQLPELEAEEQQVQDLVKEKLPMLETEEQRVQDLVKEKLPMLEAQEQQLFRRHEIPKYDSHRSECVKESAKDENQHTSEATGDDHHVRSAGGVTPLPTSDGDIITTAIPHFHMIQERGDFKGFQASMQ